MSDQARTDVIWAALASAAVRTTLAVAAVTLAAGFCLGPLWVLSSAADRARQMQRHLGSLDQRITSLEHAPPSLLVGPTPEPAAYDPSVVCGGPVDPVVALGNGIYLVRPSALANGAVSPPWAPPVRLVPVARAGRPFGLRIARLRPENPLAAMGLRPGDVVTRVDRSPVVDRVAMDHAVERALNAGHATLTVRRGGRSRTFTYVFAG